MTGAAPTPAAARLLGTVVSGRYRIEELIEESPTGALFRGEHVHMHKRIAVKVLFAGAASQAEHLARFEREAIAGAHVDHPAVAAAKDFGTLDDGAQFLVLEHLDGPTLAAELGQGALPLDRSLHVARQIALGLDAAHAIGIVHRSLTPEKVHLVSRGGDRDMVKVIDFGLALLPHALVAESAAQGGEGRAQRVATPIGAVPTSIAYAAPELVAGRQVDGRADLYSLGAMLFEMLTGRRPDLARGAPPPSIAGAPAAVEAMVHRLLAEDPELRTPTAAAAVEELDIAQPAPPRRAAPSAASLAGGGRGSLAAVPSARASASSLARAPETTAPTVMTSETSGRRSLALLAADASGAAAAIVMPGGAGRALPTPVLFAAGGGLAIILVVAAAIALRSPASEAALDDAPNASAAAAASGASPRSSRAGTSPAAAPSHRAEDDRPEAPEGAREVWARLSTEVGSRRCKEGVASLERLLELDPKAPQDREVRAAIVRLAQDVMLLDGPEPGKMFDLISNEMGTTGPDILYELMTTRGGSRAARRSEELLRDEAIRDRGTPALRIAYDLRSAKKCEAKIALFERAKTDGDGRTLGLLQLLNHSCGRRNADCCLHNDPALKATMDAIKDR